MKLLFRLSIFLLLAPLFSSGQISFYPGYAITLKGDTMNGYIYYRSWEYNPKTITFKNEAKGKTVQLGTQDIRFFSINIGYALEFQKYEGKVTTDNTNVNTILEDRDTSYRLDTVFLKILRKGNNVILYSYDDAIKTRYFIAEAPVFQPVELIRRIYFNKNLAGPEGRTVNENTYKKQLIVLAEKYGKQDDKFNADLEKADYNEPDLEGLISKINGVPNIDITKHNDLGSPPKVKLVLMLAFVAVIAVLVFSVRHN